MKIVEIMKEILIHFVSFDMNRDPSVFKFTATS